MRLTERPAVTVTALITVTGRGTVSAARLVVGSVAGVPFTADVTSLTGAGEHDFADRARACAAQAAAACAPLPGTASADYLRHLVNVHSRDALTQAFAAAGLQPRS
jgi:CO/xanthine dehydrogenase FAD-binding subunit